MENMLMQLIPLLVPMLVLALKKSIVRIPKDKIPLIVASLGGVSGLFIGQPDAEIIATFTQVLNNAFVGLAGVGVYEVYKAPKRNK